MNATVARWCASSPTPCFDAVEITVLGFSALSPRGHAALMVLDRMEPQEQLRAERAICREAAVMAPHARMRDAILVTLEAALDRAGGRAQQVAVITQQMPAAERHALDVMLGRALHATATLHDARNGEGASS